MALVHVQDKVERRRWCLYAALCLKTCLAGRSRHEAQGSATSSGWGTQIR